MWPDGKRFTTVHELKKSIILQLVSHSQVECFWCKPSIIWHFHLESSCCWVPETSIVSSCRMSWNEYHCNPAMNVLSCPVEYQIPTINHYYLLHIPCQQSSILITFLIPGPEQNSSLSLKNHQWNPFLDKFPMYSYIVGSLVCNWVRWRNDKI